MSDTAEKTERGNRKTRQGVVLSNAMSKTLVVRVDRRMTHPLYGKVVNRHKKYYAHDENNEAKVGDVVAITETRPYSKLKRWRFTAIVQAAAKTE